jgi:SAM-dependent methyltransferase
LIEVDVPERTTDYDETVAFFDRFAAVDERWRRKNLGYHHLVVNIHRSLIPEGASVLEIGAGSGELLSALRPRDGVGIDVSSKMVELARGRHSHLSFDVASGEEYEGNREFEYIVLSDLVPYASDLLALFKNVARHCTAETRIVIHSYSQLWRPILRLAELLRLKPRKPIRNWVTAEDVVGLLTLAELETITVKRRILFPKRVPLLSTFLNGIVGVMWPLTHLCLTWWVVARPRARGRERELSVSVVCPCRDEAGTIERIVEEVPHMGAGTELVFVEGGSVDGTREEILRQIALRPQRDIVLVDQPGRGKADAVRSGFERATGNALMILDADLTVPPAELSQFYAALADGHGELINGSRLVYERGPRSKRFCNLVANKLFSVIFSWLLGQHVKDTLCGTKALLRRNYDKVASRRDEGDPFGDFDLLIGAALLNLRIVDVPVHYGSRTYGRTKISRFWHGWLLLRMAARAFRRLNVEPVQSGTSR